MQCRKIRVSCVFLFPRAKYKNSYQINDYLTKIKHLALYLALKKVKETGQ